MILHSSSLKEKEDIERFKVKKQEYVDAAVKVFDEAYQFDDRAKKLVGKKPIQIFLYE